jgi:hypothetical protein
VDLPLLLETRHGLVVVQLETREVDRVPLLLGPVLHHRDVTGALVVQRELLTTEEIVVAVNRVLLLEGVVVLSVLVVDLLELTLGPQHGVVAQLLVQTQLGRVEQETVPPLTQGLRFRGANEELALLVLLLARVAPE